MTAAEASRALQDYGELDASPAALLNSADAFQRAHRRARSLTHPDRNAGDRTKWDQVEAAAAVLRAHHGIAS